MSKSRSGYIALIALLIITGTALTAGLAVSLRGIEEIQLSFAKNQAAKAKAVALTCVEDGLDRLRQNWASYSGSLSIGTDSCIINATVVGSTATLEATGNVGIYTQKIEVQVNNNLEVDSWQD